MTRTETYWCLFQNCDAMLMTVLAHMSSETNYVNTPFTADVVMAVQ